MNFKKISLLFGLMLTIIIMQFALVNAAPQGPANLTISSSERNSMSTTPAIVQAEAGNVTAIKIDGSRVTKAWQGYYGNVTGTITLDNADNYTFYDWALPNPNGEVYASNGSSVTWANIYCVNVTPGRANWSDIVNSNTNGSQVELDFGINTTDFDGLNETFNDTFTGDIDVGSVNIDVTDGCSMAHPFQDQNHNTAWDEILLSDNTSIIFTAILNDNTDMFKTLGSETADFQMLVLEDGHVGSESTATNYYFYVELS